MNNIFSLYSVLAKNSEMKVPKNEEKGTLYLSLGIIALSCIMIPCCLIVGYVSYIITKALIAAGAPTGGLLAQIQIMSAFSMIFGILVIFNVLFFSSDREHLMPLPIKTSHILTAKFLYSYVAESIMEFMILVSMFIGFFIAYKASIVSILSSIVGVVLIPLLPMVYCALISLVIMSTLKGIKNPKLFNHISTLLLIAFVVLFIFSLKETGNITIDNYINSLSDGSNSFSKMLNVVFFTVPLLLKAIEGGNILYLLLYIAINIAVFFLMIFIGSFTYEAGLFAVGSMGSRKKGGAVAAKDIKQTGIVKAYIRKDFRVILRTRAFASNCLYINLIWPLGLFALIMANKDKVGFIKFSSYFRDNVPGATILVTMGIIGLSFVATAMNSLASTAFTREGAHLDIIHYLPMSYKDQIFAKSMVSFIGTYPLIALTILIWCIYTSCNPLFIPLFLALSFACFYITCLLGLYMDSLHPYTEWDDEYSALRGNLNNFFNMAIVMVISVIICGIPFLLYNFAGLTLLAFMIIVALSLGILAFICHTFISKAIIRNIQALR